MVLSYTYLTSEITKPEGSVKICQFVPKENVRIDFEAADKADFFRKAVAAICEQRPEFDSQCLVELLEEREGTMSTGIGYGIAIPHVMYEKCHSHEIFLFRLKAPIDFAALDGNPVSLLIVMVGAKSPSNIVNLQILAKLALLTKRQDFIQSLMDAADRDELYDILVRHD